jgi:acyl-CoA thioesterase I
MGDFWVKDGETFLLIGDSITDCGRRGDAAPLGAGYVKRLTELITANYMERDIRYINTGIGGNKITDLKGRWQEDMLDHKPDRLSIMIGINDLHSYLRDPENGVGPDLYAEIFDELLDVTKKELGCPVVLITPFYISREAPEDPFQKQVMEILPEYIGTMEKMSRKYDTRLVNTQQVFQEHLKYREPEEFRPEPVHPYPIGHAIVACAVYEELDKG